MLGIGGEVGWEWFLVFWEFTDKLYGLIFERRSAIPVIAATNTWVSRQNAANGVFCYFGNLDS